MKPTSTPKEKQDKKKKEREVKTAESTKKEVEEPAPIKEEEKKEIKSNLDIGIFQSAILDALVGEIEMSEPDLYRRMHWNKDEDWEPPLQLLV